MIGQTVSYYKILEKIGEGGMGVVYKAHDTKLDRTVALKFLPSHLTESEEDKQRFIREAKTIATLNHPNVCTIYSIDEYEESQFIAMEYIEGTTLRKRLRNDPKDLSTVSDYALQIADALAEAHDKGIVHRDIKPENIMVGPKGRIKVMDFGLAKLKGSQNLTRQGGVMGTMAYMSPEQIRGDDLDMRSDLFSFGIVLYEMMTGVHPFMGEYEQATGFKLLNEDPKPPSSYQPGISSGLENIVIRCLEKDRDKRYSTARDIRIELEGEMKWPMKKAVELISDKYRLLPESLKSGRRPVILSASIGILLIVLAGLLFYSNLTDETLEEQIPQERHIVVLPFSNLSSDVIPASLNDGITETLTSKITQMEMHQGSLWVVPSTEVRKEQVTSVSEASQLFGANLAVTGSIQRYGDRFRLTVNLVDGSTRRQLRSSVLEHEWTDFAHLQDDVVRALSQMLEIEMAPEDVRTMTAGGSLDSDAYRYYIEARGYLSRYEDAERINAAIRKFHEAIEADPGYVRAYAGLGEAYWRKFDLTREVEWTELAMEYGRKAIELNDQVTDVFITMALIYNGTGRHEEALDVMEGLDEKEELNYAALIERARAYAGLGREARAEEVYHKAIEKKDTFWGGYNNLGVFYYNRGRYEEAALQFRKVIQLTPENIRGYNNLGGIYFEQQKFDQAKEYFERSLSVKPNEVALSNLGTLYFYQNNYQEAIRKFEESLELRDTDYMIWANLGSAYYWAGEEQETVRTALERAVELAEEMREINPNDPMLLLTLAGSYALLEKPDQVRRLLNQLISMNLNHPQILARIAHSYEMIDDRESALFWLEKALEQGLDLQTFERLPGAKGLMEDLPMAETQNRNGGE